MVRHQKDNFPPGLTLIVNDADTPAAPNASAAQTGSAAAPSMMLDFGIIALDGGGQWSDASDRERALLLISGSVRFEWDGRTQEARRASCFDENPEALQIPAGMPVKLTAGENGAELAYEACINPAAFEPVYYSKDDIRADVFGAGVMNEASIRTVRTVFDGENAEFSQMVLGEVINHPGKWSSYPPHDHPHPEIYHYRLFPQTGFGISVLEDDARKINNQSTSLIAPNITHSQVAAAGYAMYYIWMIPHLPGNRWLPSTRYFRREHQWLLDPSQKIWPERPSRESV